MASIIMINGKWRAQVRRKGVPALTRTFKTAADAENWAEEAEAAASRSLADRLAEISMQPLAVWQTVDPTELQRFDLERFSGIYFLFEKGALVYIGQAIHVPRRIEDHFTSKSFDSWSWIRVPPSRLTEAETYLIRKFRPPLNVTHNRPRRHVFGNDRAGTRASPSHS